MLSEDNCRGGLKGNQQQQPDQMFFLLSFFWRGSWNGLNNRNIEIHLAELRGFEENQQEQPNMFLFRKGLNSPKYGTCLKTMWLK